VKVGGGKGRKGRGEEREEWEGGSFMPRSGPPTFLRIYAHVTIYGNVGKYNE